MFNWLLKPFKDLMRTTIPYGPIKEINGYKLQMEMTAYSGQFTSVYIYNSKGQKIWKSRPEFTSNVHRMSAESLQKWFDHTEKEFQKVKEERRKFYESRNNQTTESI